jgi:hypothetical protein
MKYLVFTILFSFTVFFTKAQTYIRFIDPIEINGIKFLKGEIYQQKTDGNILFGNNEIKIQGAKTEKVSNINIVENPFEIVRKDDKSYYSINVNNYIKNKDTIKLVKANGGIIPFVTKGEEKIHIEECGDIFRIIIPNHLSIIYKKSEIPNPIPAVSNIKNDENEPDKPEKERSGLLNLSWWKYLLGIILIFVIYISYKTFKHFFIRDKYPIYQKYSGGDLNEFALSANISRKKLFKYNKDKIGNYDSMNHKDQGKLKDRLKGKDFIIGYSDIYTIGYSDIYTEPRRTNAVFEEVKHKPQATTETYQQQQHNYNNNDISAQIQRMENKILSKIDSMVPNKETSHKIENQQKEIESLKSKIALLNKDIEKSNIENNTSKNELSQIQKIKQQIESEHAKFSEKVIIVDFLESYSKITSDYYNYCQSGYDKVIEHYKRLHHSDSELVSLISLFLVKYISNIPPKTNHWIGVINEIKDSKATANIDLIRSLKQIQNNDEKIKEFKRLLLKEVFEKYSSAILILSEELSNLSKFTNDNSSVMIELEQFFKSFKSELHSKIKTIGLDLNYVPLFVNYEEFAPYLKSANQNCSFPYKRIRNISKDDVLEIINYGFGHEVTNVILA